MWLLVVLLPVVFVGLAAAVCKLLRVRVTVTVRVCSRRFT